MSEKIQKQTLYRTFRFVGTKSQFQVADLEINIGYLTKVGINYSLTFLFKKLTESSTIKSK